MQFNVQLDVTKADHADYWRVKYEAKAHESLTIAQGTIGGPTRDHAIESAFEHIEKEVKTRAAYQFDDA